MLAWAQLCLTLCDPVNCSLSGSSDHGISQARILEWVVISFSSGSSWSRDPMHLSCLAGDSLTLSHLGSPLKKERVIYFILNLQQLKEAQYFISFFWVLVRLYKTCFGNTPLIYLPSDSEGCHFWEHTAAVSGCGSGGICEIWRCLMGFLTSHDRGASVLIFRFWKRA